jgi:hypothetical protein
MKKYLLLGLICGTIHASAVITTVTDSTTVLQPQNDKELAWVDEQIQAILPSRVGVPEGFINSLRDPMKMKKTLPTVTSGSKLLAPPTLGSGINVLSTPKVIEEPLRLMAIMNKTVLINGKWYKVGESVRNFTLSEVKHNSVLLTGKKDQKLILFLTKQNKNIKITTK